MVLGLFILAACLLIGLLLFVLPLGFSVKEKILILLTSAFLGALGLLGESFFLTWQIILIQVVLAFLISFILSKRMGQEAEIKTEEIEAKPLFAIEELEARASKFKTLDVYYKALASKTDGKNASFKGVEEFEKSEVGILEGQDLLDVADRVDEAAEEVIDKPVDSNSILSQDDILKLFEEHRKDEAASELEVEKDEDHLESPSEVVEPKEEINLEEIQEEVREHSRTFNAENEDDAEKLMKARMQLFSELENEEPFDEDEASDEMEETDEASTIDIDDRSEITDDKKQGLLNEDVAHEAEQRDSKSEQEDNKRERPSIEFDDEDEDLEELYMKRRKNED